MNHYTGQVKTIHLQRRLMGILYRMFFLKHLTKELTGSDVIGWKSGEFDYVEKNLMAEQHLKYRLRHHR